ncbi:cytidine deaminase [Trichomonascus vanleenenianus]|uniref:cytidine deaminase n=1 Tax=Trichomonascus vanleenenianus TaxID=2268995 RepID=UPI003ECB6079
MVGVDKLQELVLEAKEKSYSPYSKFRVGAVIVTKDGSVFQGANMENASYGATVCAERTAAVKALYAGQREFKTIAVVSDLDGPCSPCGICRQFLREFTPKEAKVYLFHNDKGVTESTMGDLLPMSFGPDELAENAKSKQ